MFDLDGTTLDSIPLIEKAFGTVNHWIRTASTADPAEEDLKEGIDLLHGTMGMMLYSQVQRMMDRTTRSKFDVMNAAKALSEKFGIAFRQNDPVLAFSAISEAFMLAELESGDIALLPGAQEMIEHLSNKGILVYIGTGNFKSIPDLVLTRLLLRQRFAGIFGEVCCSGSAYPGGKNDMLEMIRRQTGFRYHQILMIGDGENDMRATKKNSCRFVGIGLTGGNYKRETALSAAGADFLAPDLSAWRAYLEPLGLPQ